MLYRCPKADVHAWLMKSILQDQFVRWYHSKKLSYISFPVFSLISLIVVMCVHVLPQICGVLNINLIIKLE